MLLVWSNAEVFDSCRSRIMSHHEYLTWKNWLRCSKERTVSIERALCAAGSTQVVTQQAGLKFLQCVFTIRLAFWNVRTMSWKEPPNNTNCQARRQNMKLETQCFWLHMIWTAVNINLICKLFICQFWSRKKQIVGQCSHIPTCQTNHRISIISWSVHVLRLRRSTSTAVDHHDRRRDRVA